MIVIYKLLPAGELICGVEEEILYKVYEHKTLFETYSVIPVFTLKLTHMKLVLGTLVWNENSYGNSHIDILKKKSHKNTVALFYIYFLFVCCNRMYALFFREKKELSN